MEESMLDAWLPVHRVVACEADSERFTILPCVVTIGVAGSMEGGSGGACRAIDELGRWYLVVRFVRYLYLRRVRPRRTYDSLSRARMRYFQIHVTGNRSLT